ncbi:MAG: hypothetical protein TREMPRED_004680, partial [Tremellales sp. Tagirdzhanova-0007]
MDAEEDHSSSGSGKPKRTSDSKGIHPYEVIRQLFFSVNLQRGRRGVLIIVGGSLFRVDIIPMIKRSRGQAKLKDA